MTRDELEKLGITKQEGDRVVRTPSDTASARYAIAHLADGRFAVRIQAEYWCGDHAGRGIPWTVHSTREECVEHFLQQARRHFAAELGFSPVNEAQHEARAHMQDALNGNLFGFLEPDPETQSA